MAGILDQTQLASFGGYTFACPRYSIRGSARDGVHEFRHTPGGQPEKHGRRLYTVEMDATFVASSTVAEYRNGFPDVSFALRSLFDAVETKDLVIPTVGTIQAYAIDWTFDVDFARMRDGERAHFTFREDMSEEFLGSESIQVQYASLPVQTDALLAEVDAVDMDPDFFASVVTVANDISAIGQQVELQGELLSDKLDSLIVSCQRLDETLALLNEPPHFKVAASLRKLGVAAIRLRKDVLRKSLPLVPFIVPTGAPMSIVEVAISLYGETSRAVELMQLNDLDDPLTIPAGTELRVYVPLVSKAA